MRRPPLTFASCGLLLAMLLAVLLVLGCASGAQHKRWLGLDTAQYHVQTGLLFLERGKPEDARRELALAVELDPGCGVAYCGLTVACAQLERFPEARDHLAKARALAKDDRSRCQTNVANIRLLAAERPVRWLEEAQALYVQAASLCPQDTAAAYYMALCYRDALRLERSAALLQVVAQAGGAFADEAAAEWRLVERARRCTPRSELGRELAARAALTRAEVAALLAAELNIAGEWSGPAPPDLAAHRLKAQVLPVLALRLGPLRPYGDGTFHPDTPLTRAEFAELAVAILAHLDPEGIEWQAPPRPPYPDLSPDLPGYRALTLCATRGLLEVRDLFTGQLEPASPVSGADALLAIGRLREERGPR